MPQFQLLLALAAAYVIGAIPFGFLLFWAIRREDIRKHGSGNIGATNVGRVLGWRWFPLVFALDFLKGAAPVWGARQFVLPPEGWTADDVAILAGLAAILGHMFPVFLGFKGGKGVATSAGVTCMLLPWPFAAALAAWFLVFLPTRYVSLSSLTAALVLVLSQIAWTWPEPFGADDRNLTLFAIAGAALVAVRHRSNVVRLWNGTEPKSFQRPKEGNIQIVAK
jgi:acyl phosphate:glycerol-3-phosphate acyltransferase